MNIHVWALHDALYELARQNGLRSFRIECKVTERGETMIALVLNPSSADIGRAGARRPSVDPAAIRAGARRR